MCVCDVCVVVCVCCDVCVMYVCVVYFSIVCVCIVYSGTNTEPYVQLYQFRVTVPPNQITDTALHHRSMHIV